MGAQGFLWLDHLEHFSKALGKLQAEHELSQSRITEFLEDASERSPKFK